ncbi:phosphotransferase [Actinoplanes sp. NPDC026619]|uniref:phosphotransferase family protein n=1 Tax=Actinoplanes sp. NPDC026619 TaxID=3155798 RepID=UPI0033CAE175
MVAPIDGSQVLWPLSESHALSVYPLINGTAGDFGPHDDSREGVLGLIATLHLVEPIEAAQRTGLEIPGRANLLTAIDGPWAGGPYAANAQALLAAHDRQIRSRLDDHERMAAELRATTADWVITHGEPHPGNVLHTVAGLLLIDWDTVRIAPPERDLWLRTRDPFTPAASDLARYQEATGRAPSQAGLDFYRLSWILADIAAYTDGLRRPHGEGGDAEDALAYLEANLRMP